MAKTLQKHLVDRIFGENGAHSDSPIDHCTAIYTLMASMEKASREMVGRDPRPEDFAIDQLPVSVRDDDIQGYIREFYESEGYNAMSLKEFPGPDMRFIRGDQKLGINVSYNLSLRTCLVTVLDCSDK